MNHLNILNADRDSIPFEFGFQRNRYDNAPVRCSSPTWEDFVVVFDETRDTAKGGFNIVAAMAGDDVVLVGKTPVPRRCKGNVQPRRWIAFDLDGDTRIADQKVPLSDDKFADIVLAMQSICLGLYYETSSSRPGSRHARFVLALDTPLPNGSAEAVCRYVEGLLPNADWDASVYAGSQPLYLPLVGSKVVTFGEEPLNVASVARSVIAMAPKPKPIVIRPQTPLQIEKTTLTLGCLAQLGLHIKEEGSGKHTIICPWGDRHTDGRLEAAYYEPSPSNGGIGGYKCLHSHCADRNIGDLLSFIDDCAGGVRHAA